MRVNIQTVRQMCDQTMDRRTFRHEELYVPIVKPVVPRNLSQ